jgi:hypothetical protein
MEPLRAKPPLLVHLTGVDFVSSAPRGGEPFAAAAVVTLASDQRLAAIVFAAAPANAALRCV